MRRPTWPIKRPIGYAASEPPTSVAADGQPAARGVPANIVPVMLEIADVVKIANSAKPWPMNNTVVNRRVVDSRFELLGKVMMEGLGIGDQEFRLRHCEKRSDEAISLGLINRSEDTCTAPHCGASVAAPPPMARNDVRA